MSKRNLVSQAKSSRPPHSWLDSANMWRHRRAGLRLESGVVLARTLAIHEPERIWIRGGAEVRRNSTLDGRSSHDTSISIGEGCRIKENVWLAAYGGTIELGDAVLIGRNNVILGHGGVVIGSYAMLGPNVVVLSSEHSTAFGPDHPPFQFQPENPRPVVIGEGAWIGAGATVLGGSVVEPHVVVAAGAVVTAGVLESGFVYAGVPAKKLRPLKSDPPA